MKLFIKKLFNIIILLSISYVAIAKEVEPFYLKHPFLCSSPQFGFDAGFSNIQFAQDQGHQMFAKQQFPITGYFNISFNDNWGIEIGYTMPKKKNNKIRLNEGDLYPGQTINRLRRGYFAEYEAFIEIRQPYIGLKYDLHFISHKSYFFGIVGVTSTKVRAQWQQVNGTPASFDPRRTPTTTKRVFDFRKNIPFVKAGVYVPFPWNEHIFIRLVATWFNTSQLKSSVQGYGTDELSSIKAKNTIHYSIGLAYSI